MKNNGSKTKIRPQASSPRPFYSYTDNPTIWLCLTTGRKRKSSMPATLLRRAILLLHSKELTMILCSYFQMSSYWWEMYQILEQLFNMNKLRLFDSRYNFDIPARPGCPQWKWKMHFDSMKLTRSNSVGQSPKGTTIKAWNGSGICSAVWSAFECGRSNTTAETSHTVALAFQVGRLMGGKKSGAISILVRLL